MLIQVSSYVDTHSGKKKSGKYFYVYPLKFDEVKYVKNYSVCVSKNGINIFLTIETASIFYIIAADENY